MKVLGWMLALACISTSALARADAVDAAKAMTLARGNACMGCHAVSSQRMGPSFQAVAGKYKGDTTALAKLTLKVQKGGAGVWGMIPMPSHPGLSTADAQTIVTWILAGAPPAS